MDEHQLERLKETKRDALTNWVYAAQRLDLLILSISSGGIYTVLETIKYVNENHLLSTSGLKSSGGFFVAAIIINFISQYTGMMANDKHIRHCNAQIKAHDPPNEDEVEKIADLDKSANEWDRRTQYLNYASVFAMFVGLIAIMRYFVVTL